jgi:hypothetical protein
MASLTDILTAVQNAVTGINNLAQTWIQIQGLTSVSGITSATTVKSSAGRVVNVNVIVAGSANGTIYDAVSSTITSYPVYKIPNTVGVYVINFPVLYGIYVVPGTGQTVSVSYS